MMLVFDKQEAEMLKWHCGHKIEVVTYSEGESIEETDIECVTCNVVLFSASMDIPENKGIDRKEK